MYQVFWLKQRALIIFWIIFGLIIISSIVRIAYFHGHKYHDIVSYGNQAFATLNVIVYMIVIFRLHRQMKMLQGMSQERKQIWLQSISFLIMYLTLSICTLV